MSLTKLIFRREPDPIPESIRAALEGPIGQGIARQQREVEDRAQRDRCARLAAARQQDLDSSDLRRQRDACVADAQRLEQQAAALRNKANTMTGAIMSAEIAHRYTIEKLESDIRAHAHPVLHDAIRRLHDEAEQCRRSIGETVDQSRRNLLGQYARMSTIASVRRRSHAIAHAIDHAETWMLEAPTSEADLVARIEDLFAGLPELEWDDHMEVA